MKLHDHILIKSDTVYTNVTTFRLRVVNKYSGRTINIKPDDSFYVIGFFTIRDRYDYDVDHIYDRSLYAEFLRIKDKKPILIDLENYHVLEFFEKNMLAIDTARTLVLKLDIKKKGLKYGTKKRVYL